MFKLITIFAILFPSLASGSCIKPFVGKDHLNAPIVSAGLTAPIPNDFFRYTNCELRSRNHCLISADIVQENQKIGSVLLQNFSDISIGEAVASGPFRKLTVDKGDDGIYAATIELREDVVVIVNIAVNGDQIFALYVEHRIGRDETLAAQLQKYIRKNVVVCDN